MLDIHHKMMYNSKEKQKRKEKVSGSKDFTEEKFRRVGIGGRRFIKTYLEDFI